MKSPANLGKGSRAGDTEQGDSTEQSDDRQFNTSNPRHHRVLLGLLRRAMPREHIDSAAGASNGPDLIAELRRRGLDLPCDRIPVFDRDGLEVKRGVYHLTPKDRRKIHYWFSTFRGAGMNHDRAASALQAIDYIMPQWVIEDMGGAHG